MKKIIYIDQDDTISNFGGYFKDRPVNESEMFEPGFFANLEPVPGALVAVRKLIRLGYDVQILTQPVAESPHCYAEKVQWIGKWFPELISKINMVQDKGNLSAPNTYLVDDNEPKWKAKFESRGGKFVHFPYSRISDDINRFAWKRIIEFFENQEEDV